MTNESVNSLLGLGIIVACIGALYVAPKMKRPKLLYVLGIFVLIVVMGAAMALLGSFKLV